MAAAFKRQRQATLFSLGGVVNLTEVKVQKHKLEDSSVSAPEKLEILAQLGQKKPSTDALIETGIGKTVKKLAKRRDAAADAEVKGAAQKVYELWRREVEKREALKERGPLEVQCDLDTQHWRAKAKRLFRNVVQKDDGLDPAAAEPILEAVERELFNFCEHLIQSRYRCSVRKIVFALKGNPDLRSQVFRDLSVSARQLVAEHHA